MQNNDMPSSDHMGSILVTGASGHIGSETCRVLRIGGRVILPVDVEPNSARGVIACDLRLKDESSRLFQLHPIQTVIHLAGLLPSAFRSDPLRGAEVNLSSSFELMRQAANSGVRRFLFASSMSVYGSSPSSHPLTEDDPATPDEPYGASKRAVELIGETLAVGRAMKFVSLRIARVIGPGIKKTASPWRSRIFEPLPGGVSIQIPFAPETMLSLVHVEDVARMLFVLVDRPEMGSFVYNTPAELWQARELKQLIEETVDTRVELGHDRSSVGPPVTAAVSQQNSDSNYKGFESVYHASRSRRLKDEESVPAFDSGFVGGWSATLKLKTPAGESHSQLTICPSA